MPNLIWSNIDQMRKKSIPESVKWQIVGLNKQGKPSCVAIVKLVGVSEGCFEINFKSLNNLRLSKILQGLQS